MEVLRARDKADKSTSDRRQLATCLRTIFSAQASIAVFSALLQYVAGVPGANKSFRLALFELGRPCKCIWARLVNQLGSCPNSCPNCLVHIRYKKRSGTTRNTNAFRFPSKVSRNADLVQQHGQGTITGALNFEPSVLPAQRFSKGGFVSHPTSVFVFFHNLKV